MKYKKFTIISLICLIVMIVGVVLLSSHSVSKVIGDWVMEGAGEGHYTIEQRELYTKFMLVLILGMPFFALLIGIISAIRRSMLKKKLVNEGRYDEYRELFGKCDN